jgi:hypothetical protein
MSREALESTKLGSAFLDPLARILSVLGSDSESIRHSFKIELARGHRSCLPSEHGGLSQSKWSVIQGRLIRIVNETCIQ